MLAGENSLPAFDLADDDIVNRTREVRDLAILNRIDRALQQLRYPHVYCRQPLRRYV